MNESVKILENLMMFVETEINRLSADKIINRNVHESLRKAKLQAISVKQHLELARGWNTNNNLVER